MALYSDNLFTLTGRIRSVKPNARPNDCRQWINDRIRRLIDRRIFWADLLARAVVQVPNAYIAGTVTLTQNSSVMTGAGTGWPVSDAVNTVLSSGIQDYGYQEVTPGSMQGIAIDSLLYVDGAGTPEVVAVVSTTPSTFTANFKSFHNQNATVTMSSLAGMQVKVGGNYPTYTARAIVSSTSALLDTPWAGTTLTGQAYQMLQMYYTIAPDMKDALAIWDPLQATPLAWHMSLALINNSDPQRQTTGDPVGFADYAPLDSGSMQYELWPNQTAARQIQVVYTRQWPELVNPTDRPPYFINPSVLVDGAIADALRARNAAPGEQDPWFNPKLADTFEGKFELGVGYAMNADESKAQQALDQLMNHVVAPGSAAFYQSHLYPGDYSDGLY